MGKPKTKKAPEHIRDLTPDPQNARKHSPRNIGEIGDSLARVGAARSIVIDEDGRILAGNGTVEAAAERGITKVLTVDADGETIVAVRRSGLTKAQKAELAIRDNRAAEGASWDVPMLETLAQANELKLPDLGFTAAEIRALAVSSSGGSDGASSGGSGCKHCPEHCGG